MLEFMRALVAFVHRANGGSSVDAVPPPPPSTADLPSDPLPAVVAEQARQQEQWLEHVAASVATQQAIEAAAATRHEP